MAIIKRQTIRIGSKLEDLLSTGACAASSLPKRLDILASRYQTLMASTKPPIWSVETWMALVTLAKVNDLSQMSAIFAIQGMAKAQSETRLSFSS